MGGETSVKHEEACLPHVIAATVQFIVRWPLELLMDHFVPGAMGHTNVPHCLSRTLLVNTEERKVHVVTATRQDLRDYR